MSIRFFTPEQIQRYLSCVNHLEQQLLTYQSVAHGVVDGRLAEEQIVIARAALIEAVSQAILAFQTEIAISHAGFPYRALQRPIDAYAVNALSLMLLQNFFVKFPQLGRLVNARIINTYDILSRVFFPDSNV